MKGPPIATSQRVIPENSLEFSLVIAQQVALVVELLVDKKKEVI